MKYRYVEPGPHGEEITVVITEEQIIDKYWDYWCDRMRSVGKEDQISPKACIEDFLVIHWATPVEE